MRESLCESWRHAWSHISNHAKTVAFRPIIASSYAEVWDRPAVGQLRSCPKPVIEYLRVAGKEKSKVAKRKAQTCPKPLGSTNIAAQFAVAGDAKEGGEA